MLTDAWLSNSNACCSSNCTRGGRAWAARGVGGCSGGTRRGGSSRPGKGARATRREHVCGGHVGMARKAGRHCKRAPGRRWRHGGGWAAGAAAGPPAAASRLPVPRLPVPRPPLPALLACHEEAGLAAWRLAGPSLAAMLLWGLPWSWPEGGMPAVWLGAAADRRELTGGAPHKWRRRRAHGRPRRLTAQPPTPSSPCCTLAAASQPSARGGCCSPQTPPSPAPPAGRERPSSSRP